MELGEADADGRCKPKPIPDSEFEIPIDMVITALGQKARAEFLYSLPKLKIENGCIAVDTRTFQSGNPKVFAGGDCINGGKEVVNAAYDGKHAAHGIDKFLSNKIS